MTNDKKIQIILKNVCKNYGKHCVLNNINLEIYQGDFICIFGKSGGGKTTLLNIIGTLESYDSGIVECFSELDPVNHSKVADFLRREKIAYLFQNFALVEKMTVEENMLMAVKYSKAKDKKNLIKSALSEMGILDKLNSKVFELSGGEQQRVALARNMVKPFDIMLADEPTGSLDDDNKKIVIETLLKLNKKGKTIIIVSHDKEFASVAKRIYMIENSQIKEGIR